MRNIFTRLVFEVYCALVLLTGSALAGEVNLSIAASLKDVINELSENFAKQNARYQMSEELWGFRRSCQTDRERRPGRHFHLGQYRMDGLPEK